MNNSGSKTAVRVTVDKNLPAVRPARSPLAPTVAGLLCLAMAGIGNQAHAAAAQPPSAGAIQKQIQPPPSLPSPPGQVITLPKPSRHRSTSTLEIPVRSITVRGNTLLAQQQLHHLVKETEGKTVRLAQLQALTERITAAYHHAGYPLAYAYLPAQKIRDGRVVIDVVEPKYGAITVTGHSRLKPDVAKRTVGLAPGKIIEEAPLTRGLILLSQTPGVTAHALFSPGAQPDTSALQLDVKDTPMVVGNVFVNNSGNPVVGSTLVGADGAVRNPFGYGSSISANAMTSPGGDARLSAGGLLFNSPYLWNGLRVGAYLSSTVYHLGKNFAALDESGHAQQAGVDTTYPLLLAPGRALAVRLDVLKNWLSQSTGATASVTNEGISIARVGLSGSYADSYGGISQANVSISHGDLTISEADAQAVDAAGPKTAGAFDILAFRLSHYQPLAHRFALLTRLSGQLSDKNLDSSQKFYLGGPNGVISYQVGDGGGDEGYLLDVELSHPLPVERLPGRLTGALVAQVGGVRVNHTVYAGFGGPNSLTEAGVGVKLAYGWKRWRLITSYGRRIGSYSRSGAAEDHTGQFWVSLAKGF